jgi:hypothetical protein
MCLNLKVSILLQDLLGSSFQCIQTGDGNAKRKREHNATCAGYPSKESNTQSEMMVAKTRDIKQSTAQRNKTKQSKAKQKHNNTSVIICNENQII